MAKSIRGDVNDRINRDNISCYFYSNFWGRFYLLRPDDSKKEIILGIENKTKFNIS